MKLPKRLESNPLLDVIAEIRFTSEIPADAILGVVYGEIRELFGAPITLPIVQIPQQIRENDENLRYAACYKFEGKGHYLMLSPRSVALGTPRPYRDWDSITPTLIDLLSKLVKVRLFGKIERTGLRYINFFENTNIFHHTALKLELPGQTYADQNLTVRAEHKEGPFVVITQILNTTVAPVDGVQKDGSIIDLDVVCDALDPNVGDIAKSLYDAFAQSNQIADKTFFSLLHPEFVEKNFKPVY